MELDPRVLCSKESEIGVLGCCLNNNSLISKVLKELSPNDFGIEENKNIFTAMVKMFGEGKAFDGVALYTNNQELISNNGGMSYLSEISNYNMPDTISTHIAKVKEMSEKKKIATLVRKAEEKCYSNIDSKELISEIMQGCLNIETKNDNHITSAMELYYEALEGIEQAYKSKDGVSGIKTGYSSLDSLTNGLRKGDYIVIGARPSVGKTAFALNLLNSLEGTNTFLVECDMDKRAIAYRLMALRTYIANSKIAKGNLTDEEFTNIVKVANHHISKDNFSILDTSNPNVNDIYINAKILKDMKEVDVIIIDHIGKLKSDLKGKRYDQMTDISNALKKLAKDLNVCVIALCQLSRQVEQRADKRPILADLRDSGAIEEDADIVAFLYRDGYYKQREGGEKSQELDSDILEFDIQKNRNGRIGKVYFNYLLKTQIIKER